MLLFVWGLLNIGVFCYVIIVCFKATRFIRERVGMLAAVIVVLGLLSFTSNSNSNNNSEPNSNHFRTWKFSEPATSDKNKIRFMTTPMEETFISTCNLGVEYQLDSISHVATPISAYSFPTGVESGTSWKPTAIMVDKTSSPNKLAYSVAGIFEWKLLGFTLYTQPKHYSGVFNVKQSDY